MSTTLEIDMHCLAWLSLLFTSTEVMLRNQLQGQWTLCLPVIIS
jgi:hypothetical protein